MTYWRNMITSVRDTFMYFELQHADPLLDFECHPTEAVPHLALEAFNSASLLFKSRKLSCLVPGGFGRVLNAFLQ